jgi:hypothetical protein
MMDVNDSFIRLSKTICALKLLLVHSQQRENPPKKETKARFDEIAKWDRKSPLTVFLDTD